ncbi:protein of unknown function UPF0164 [Treponema brennaborense DSM 12168]|uniref:Uncharacterized protein n=2 Tax=Treponema TaxID=157 RepID=F4LQF3_TREBD|nr:protein of unknown function UPF0164 [Treponema brennaborense DSM 12168]
MFLFVLLHVCGSVLPALEYTNIQAALADAFGSLVDPNEGLTGFRSLNVPSGGRAESLGTAFTGIADDIGFFEYNPAASSVLENTEVAVFHNAWIADSALETISWTTRKNNFGGGASLRCFYLPFTEYNIFGERVAGGYYSETALTLNMSYNFLAGYYFKGLSLGYNLKTAFRSMPDYADNDTNEIIAGSGLAQSAVAVMADAGLLLRFNAAKRYASREPNLKIGLTVSNLGAAFTGFGSDGGVTLDDPLPTRIALGVSYRIIRPVLVSLEFRQPVNLQNVSESGSWSAAAGTEIRITDFFAFQAGFLLQGGNPRFSIGSEFAVSSCILNVNYTLDLTSSLNPLNRISLSAKMKLGDGGRAEKQARIDEFYNEGLRSYAQGELEEAIAAWRECLALDPRFDPAKNAISAAQESLRLILRIREIQTLD